jgi:hypothetical protein
MCGERQLRERILYPRQGGIQRGMIVDCEALVRSDIAFLFRVQRSNVGVWYVIVLLVFFSILIAHERDAILMFACQLFVIRSTVGILVLIAEAF